MNLYQINEQILSLIDFETGEIADIEELQKLNLTKEQKLENLACLIKNIESDISALEQEQDSIKKRINQKENKVENLKQYLQNFLESEGRTKFETPKCVVSFRKTESVVVTDPVALIDYAKTKGLTNLYKTKIEETPIKKELKEFLKENGDCSFAKLQKGQSMTVK